MVYHSGKGAGYPEAGHYVWTVSFRKQSNKKQRLKYEKQIQHEVSCTDVHIVTAGRQLGLSRERGAGARWQEIMHLVDKGLPQTERGKQGPPD